MAQQRARQHAAAFMQSARAVRFPRRDALRMLAAAGLTAAGAGAIGMGARTSGASPGLAGRQGEPRRHDGMHMAPPKQDTGTPVAPSLGLQADGSRVWQVLVAGDSEPDLLEYNAFFPRELTINAGDTIAFAFKGLHAPHTVTFPAGQEVPPLIMLADDGATETAERIPELMFNPAAAFPSGGVVHDGTAMLNSGLNVLLPPDQRFSVTFTTPGAFDYLCLVHPMMMKGTVTVQEQGSTVPHEQADVDAMIIEQMNALRDEGLALTARYHAATPSAAPDGRTIWDVRAGAEGEEVAVYRFLPDNLTIKAGDSVRWTDRSMFEPHTVTFLGGSEPPAMIEPRPQAEGPPRLVFNPAVIAPAGPLVYDGTEYVNSGAMGADFELFTGLTTYELTFNTPGEYPYYCALHGDPTMGMRATITVS